ncbi:MAG: hypothetical protein GY754_43965 [bacterium]|nr:hypothetical protein [bacterium]
MDQLVIKYLYINILENNLKNVLRVTECGPLRDMIIDFNDSEKDVPHSITILGGANGTGKTTTLELIFSLLDLFKFSPKDRFTSIGNLSLGILKKTEHAELKLYINSEPCIVFLGKTGNDYNGSENVHGIQCIVDEEGNKKWKMLSKGSLPKKINAFVKELKKKNLWTFLFTHIISKSITYQLYYPYNDTYRVKLMISGGCKYRLFCSNPMISNSTASKIL